MFRAPALCGGRASRTVDLLELVESIGTEAFITADQFMEKQQVFTGRPFRTLLLSTNSWPLIQEQVLVIAAVLEDAGPGVVTKVDAGNCAEAFRRPSL